MTDIPAPQAVGWGRLFDRLWRASVRPRLTVILLVWVAAVLALSLLVPQAPPRIEDPIVRSQWLASVPAGIRHLVERLEVLGVFNLLDSLWLRLPLALLLFHALLMLSAWAPAIWQRVRLSFDTVIPISKPFYLDQELPEPSEQARQAFIHRLDPACYRIVWAQDGASFIVWRWRWSWLGLAGIYLGLVLASAGLILQAWLGQVQEVNLEPDTPWPLPGRNAPGLVLREIAARGSNPLRPTGGVAVIRLVTGVGEGQEFMLKLHRSRLWRDVWVTLTDLVPVAQVAALDAQTGKPISLQSFSPGFPPKEQVRLPLAENPETRFVGVPSQNITLSVNYWPSAEHTYDAEQVPGEAAPHEDVFLLSFFRGAEVSPAYETSVRSGDEVAFDGVRYRVSLDFDARLRLNSALWWVAGGAGWAIAALGFLVLTLAPPVYAQGSLRIGENGTRVRLAGETLGDEQQRHRELRAALVPEA